MTDAATQEIEDLVGAVQADDPPPPALEPEPEPEPEPEVDMDPAPPSPEPEEAPKRKRRRVARAKANGGTTTAAAPKQQTMQELEADALLGGRVLPKPEQNVKTLGDMYAKFKVGEDPDFKIQVWRNWPKMAPGGKKFDGFYDTWEMPMSLEQIQAEYGGGTYRIAVVGPHPSTPNRTKHYDSVTIQIAGDPKWERVPRALQGQVSKTDASPAPLQPIVPMGHESPKLAEAALKMIDGVAERERQDRHRAEERATRRIDNAQSMMNPVIEAERRRADDVLAAERRAIEQRERMMEERYAEERRRNEEARRRMETSQQGQASFADSLRAMSESGLLGRQDEGVAKEMLGQILQKHQSEMEAVQRQHITFTESIRSGHANELQAIRDAHRREIEAEREASRAREARTEERLNAEREERRRDQERYRAQVADRDQQWKDRMEQQESTLKSSWESRHQSLMSTYENRLQWMQAEVDRLKQESYDLRQKREEQGDPITQIAKMAELRNVMKDALGVDPSATATAASSSGGIGISGSGDDWKQTAIEGLTERVPDILSALGMGFQKPGGAPQQQPQYQLGQIVPTPQGEMVVVQAPNGEMALAPRAAVEQHAAQQGAPSLLGGRQPQQQRPQVMPPRGSMPQKQEPKVKVIPNLAEGLPKRRPAWEGGGVEPEPAPQTSPQPQQPPASPRMTTRQPAPAPGGEPMELSAQERQGIQVVAKLVHDSVMVADEPEEFVAKVMQQYDPAMLQQIVGAYTTDQIAQGIMQLQPNSAGATPAGQHFVRAAFRELRAALRG